MCTPPNTSGILILVAPAFLSLATELRALALQIILKFGFRAFALSTINTLLASLGKAQIKL